MPDGYCPGCHYELRVPFSCKTRFCPSCGKVKVDNWVNNIATDMLDVPHLHITLTTDDLLRPFFRKDSRLLKELLRVGTQAGRKCYPISIRGCNDWSTPYTPPGVTWGISRMSSWLLPKAALWMANGWRLIASPGYRLFRKVALFAL